MASAAANAIGVGLDIAGAAADIAVGSINISQNANEENSESKKAYNITGDVLGITLNIGTTVASLFVPIVGIVVAAVQIVGTLLDSFYNPFKNYFNHDLETLRKTINNVIKKDFEDNGILWPLEVKPDLIGMLDKKHPNYISNSSRFKEKIKQYYNDNGLISNNMALEEENIYRILKAIKRKRKIYRLNNYNKYEKDDDNVENIEYVNILNILKLLKKYKERKPRTFLRNVKEYISVNYISLLTSLICFLSILSSSSLLLI